MDLSFIYRSVMVAGIMVSALATAWPFMLVNSTTAILSWCVLVITLGLLLRKVVCYVRQDLHLGRKWWRVYKYRRRRR